MYSYSQLSRCFWNRCNIAWPCRTEPSRDRLPDPRSSCYQIWYGL